MLLAEAAQDFRVSGTETETRSFIEHTDSAHGFAEAPAEPRSAHEPARPLLKDDSDSTDDVREPQGSCVNSSGSDRTGRGRSKRRKRIETDLPTAASSVFSNLVIAEDSLRVQYAELKLARRRGIWFFWLTIAAGLALVAKNWWSPSPWPLLRLLERLLAIAALITLGLFFLTGMAQKVFVEAPQFIATANRGLRDLNMRLVVEPRTWREEVMHIFSPTWSEAPGRLVKLVLNPRQFSPRALEEWELYRAEFWAKEQRRRRRKLLKKAT